MSIDRLKNEMYDEFAIGGEFSDKLFNKIIKALEQQQSLLNKIKVDLIKRADLKGDKCVDLSDGIWMLLCESTPPQDKEL